MKTWELLIFCGLGVILGLGAPMIMVKPIMYSYMVISIPLIFLEDGVPRDVVSIICCLLGSAWITFGIRLVAGSS